MKFNESFTVSGKSPAQCFEYVTNPDNGAKWADAAKEVRAEGEPGVGRKIIVKAEMIITFDITQTVTAYDPPSRYAFGATSPMKVAYDFRFAESGDGTKIDVEVDADPGKFIPGGSFVLKPKLKKDFRNDMKRLEKFLADEA